MCSVKIVLARENRKTSVGGIKFSEELTHISLIKNTADEFSLNDVLHLLAQQRINIPFLCLSATTYQNHRSCFCVNRKDFPRVQRVLSVSMSTSVIETIQSVGTLSLFPHKNSFQLLGHIIQTFGKFQFPVYSMCTSISAIALNTDYSLLDVAAEKLQEVICLPENHAPFRQEFCLAELHP